jgi:hypothetical protein
VSRGQSIGQLIYPPGHASGTYPAFVIGTGNTLVPVKFPDFPIQSKLAAATHGP